MIPESFKYTFVVQIKEFDVVIATVKLEDKNGEFIKALENLNMDKELIQQIYVGEVDFTQSPLIEKDPMPESKL